jgi:hypothetical protein
MSAASVSICVREDTQLHEVGHLFESGEPSGWLYVGESGVTLWGSPAALRRLAEGVLVAAEAGERMRPVALTPTMDVDTAAARR